MTRRYNVARIDSKNTIIGAKSSWKKIGYYCLNRDIDYYPGFKLCTTGKSSRKEEAIAHAA